MYVYVYKFIYEPKFGILVYRTTKILRKEFWKINPKRKKKES